MMIVMIKTTNVNMDVAAENPGGKKVALFNRWLYFIMINTIVLHKNVLEH